MDALIGRNLGKYQVLEPLGEGGMAAVFKAYDPTLERYVAIKIIRQAQQFDPNFLTRFHREAKALAMLDHPYILKVLDYGEHDGIPYLVMPFVAGGTLKHKVRTRIDYHQAIELLLPVASALGYAHQRKIIHRDIKPANILFSESGAPLLSDFGIAKMIDANDETQLTSAGVGIGTPDYMAPEQWGGSADERSDVYALGIVLYELITGRRPFHADTPAAILLKQVNDPLPRPKTFLPDLPDIVEALLIKALAKDPKLRFQNMAEFSQAMKKVLQTHPSTASTVVSSVPAKQEPGMIETGRPQAPAPRPKKWLPWAIGSGMLLSLVCLAIVLVTGVWQFGWLNLDRQASKEPTTQTLISELSADHQNNTPAQTLASESSLTSPPKITSAPTSFTRIEGLPDDIPVLVPNNSDLMVTTAQDMKMYAYSSSLSHTDAGAFFRQKMQDNGWVLVNTTEMTAQNTLVYAFEKNDKVAVIYLIGQEPEKTMIQIMLPEQ